MNNSWDELEQKLAALRPDSPAPAVWEGVRRRIARRRLLRRRAVLGLVILIGGLALALPSMLPHQAVRPSQHQPVASSVKLPHQVKQLLRHQPLVSSRRFPRFAAPQCSELAYMRAWGHSSAAFRRLLLKNSLRKSPSEPRRRPEYLLIREYSQ